MDKKSASLGAAATVLLAGGLFAGVSLANANTGPAPTPAVTITATPTATTTAAPTPSATPIPTQTTEPIVTVSPAPSPVADPVPAPIAPVTQAPVVQEPAAPVVTEVPPNNFGTPSPGDIKNADKGAQPTDGSTVIYQPTPGDFGYSPKR